MPEKSCIIHLNKRNTMLDLGTFGNTPAAKNFVTQLEKIQKSTQTKLVKALSRGLEKLASLEDIKNEKNRKAISRVLKHYLFLELEVIVARASLTLPVDRQVWAEYDLAVSYAKNIIATRYKKIMRGEQS